MSNTIQIKGGNSVPSKNVLAYKELGFNFNGGDLYIGDSNGNPLLIAKKGVMDKLSIDGSGNLVLAGTVIATNLTATNLASTNLTATNITANTAATLAKVIVGTGSRGTGDPSGTGADGQLYFKII